MSHKDIYKIIQGTFDYKYKSNDPIISDIYNNGNDLIYLDRSNDKTNLRNDIKKIGRDFKKAAKEASIELIIE